MLDGIHIKRIRGEATICLADGQPLYGTDTYGDLDAIRAWLSAILGARGEDVFRTFLRREADTFDGATSSPGSRSLVAAAMERGGSGLSL